MMGGGNDGESDPTCCGAGAIHAARVNGTHYLIRFRWIHRSGLLSQVPVSGGPGYTSLVSVSVAADSGPFDCSGLFDILQMPAAQPTRRNGQGERGWQ